MKYKSPSNPKEYWAIVDYYWNDLNHIINIYLPTFAKKWIDNSIIPLDKTLGEYIIELKETRNPRLVRILNSAWWNAPDEKCCEGEHKSWNVLCDLCSEEYVLYEPKEGNIDD
jgi:hypothetical protein